MSKYKTIALCGNVPTYVFIREHDRLIMKGKIPIINGGTGTVARKGLRRAVIAKADEVLVINEYGYINDEETREEIRFAQRMGKRIRFLKDPPEEWMKYSYEWEDFHALPFELRQAVRSFWKQGVDYRQESDVWNETPDNGMDPEAFKKAVYLYDALMSRIILPWRR